MVDWRKYFPSGLNVDFNLLIFVLLIPAFIGVYWLSVNDIKAGDIYFKMLVGTVVLFVIGALIFFKDENMEKISRFIKSPFGVSSGLAVFLYLLGWVVAILIDLILKLLSNFSITSFNIPLFSTGITEGINQTFTAVAFAESMAWKLFVYVFVAGTIEEFVFSWGIPILGGIIGYFIIKTFFKDGEPLGMSEENFIIIAGIVISTLAFMGAHSLNATYVGRMFIIAGFFKLFSLIGIYYLGILLTFFVGFHQANNHLWLINTEGFLPVLNGYFSWYGAIFVPFIMLLFWHLISNWEEVKEEISDYFESLF